MSPGVLRSALPTLPRPQLTPTNCVRGAQEQLKSQPSYCHGGKGSVLQFSVGAHSYIFKKKSNNEIILQKMISRDETRESSLGEKHKELSVDRGRLIKWKRRVIFELYKTVFSLSAHNTEFSKFVCFEISVGHKFFQFLYSWFRHFRILNANFPRIGSFRKCKEGFLGFPRGNIFIT